MRCNAGSIIVAVVDTDITHVESLAGSRAWARLRGRVRALPVGRRAGGTAKAPQGVAQAIGRLHDRDRRRHRPEPGALPRRSRRTGPGRTRRRDASPPRRERGVPSARLVDAPAEQLPFPDGSIDTVVSTFVLCTVDAPDLALQEIVRVLKPDGQLLFIEHVRSDSPRLARWQDRLANPWRRFARGCRCNRATSELMAALGFELEDLDDASWRAMPPIVRPLIIGRARKTAAATAATSSLVAEETLSASIRGGSIDG